MLPYGHRGGKLGPKYGRAIVERPQVLGDEKQAVAVVDMLWELGQVHHFCVQGTKFLVFLWDSKKI